MTSGYRYLYTGQDKINENEETHEVCALWKKLSITHVIVTVYKPTYSTMKGSELEKQRWSGKLN